MGRCGHSEVSGAGLPQFPRLIDGALTEHLCCNPGEAELPGRDHLARELGELVPDRAKARVLAVPPQLCWPGPH